MTRAELEQYIVERIYPNNAQEITGASLQDVLVKIIENAENKEEASAIISQIIADVATKVSQEVFDTTIQRLDTALADKATIDDIALIPFEKGEGDKSAVAKDNNNKATALGAMAIGYKNSAENAYSFVGGRNSQTTGNASSSLVFGQNAVGEGYQCAVFGNNTHAKSNYSVVGGRGTETNNPGEVAFGQYNKSDESTAFSIGNGKNADNRTNIFEVCKDGRVYSCVGAIPTDRNRVVIGAYPQLDNYTVIAFGFGREGYPGNAFEVVSVSGGAYPYRGKVAGQTLVFYDEFRLLQERVVALEDALANAGISVASVSEENQQEGE